MRGRMSMAPLPISRRRQKDGMHPGVRADRERSPRFWSHGQFDNPFILFKPWV